MTQGMILWLALVLPQADTTAGSSPSPGAVFQRAQALYDEGRFEEAAEEYESLHAAGVRDGALHYNLGNAHFKSGKLGLAILHYERALRLMPGDEATESNLAFANELVTDPAEALELPGVVQWMVDVYRSLRPDFWASLLSLCFILGGIATSMFLLGRWSLSHESAVYLVVALSLVGLVAAAVLAVKLYVGAGLPEAIVLVERADVRSAPGESNPQLAEIHEGIKVAMLGGRDDWLQVSLPNGLTGWVREGDIEIIR